MTTIISAIISAAAAIVVSLVNSNYQHKKLLAELAAHDEMNVYRIGQLEKKMDKNNSVIERTFRLEEGQKLLEEKLKVANHRIEDLERGRYNG